MKRLLFGLSILMLLVSTVVAAPGLPGRVRDTLERALANEREAAARYEAYAVRAESDGYRGAASLFRAQVRAENAHARRFAAILEQHGHAVPAPVAHHPAVGDTGENLRAAAMSEAAERDGMYRQAIDTCREANLPELAKVFDQTRDSEVEHANLCFAASGDLKAMKEEKAYYVCNKCGYTTDVRLPLCPSCRHKEPPR